MSPLETHMQAIASLVEGHAEPPTLNALLVAGTKGGPRARVYRNSSLLAASEALKSNYAATAAIMGDDFFSAMARAFVDANRPRSRSLVGYGRTLPSFIAAGEPEHGLAWLTDLARLDRAWLEAHLAADADALAADALAELASDEAVLLATKLTLAPNVRQVTCNWQVFDLWSRLRRNERPEPGHPVAQGAQQVLVWRPKGDVEYRLLCPAEAAFLSQIAAGATLGRAAEAGLSVQPEFDIGSALAAAIIDGLFARSDIIGSKT